MDAEYSEYESFDPLAYISKKYVSVTEWIAQPLRELHQVFQSYGSVPGGLKVLEYGSGPVPIYLCSATLKASEIVYAEYEKCNRDILQDWISRDQNSPDYTPFFKYVVHDLEGQVGEDSVQQRQDDLRRLIKAVVPCDVTKDPPIATGYEGPYDIIFSSLCLTVTASNIQEYSTNLSRLTNMLKSGGKLILNSVEARQGTHLTYWVGEKKFYALSLTVDSLNWALKENGYTDIKITRRLIDETPGGYDSMSPEVLAMIFVIATK